MHFSFYDSGQNQFQFYHWANPEAPDRKVYAKMFRFPNNSVTNRRRDPGEKTLAICHLCVLLHCD